MILRENAQRLCEAGAITCQAGSVLTQPVRLVTFRFCSRSSRSIAPEGEGVSPDLERFATSADWLLMAVGLDRSLSRAAAAGKGGKRHKRLHPAKQLDSILRWMAGKATARATYTALEAGGSKET